MNETVHKMNPLSRKAGFSWMDSTSIVTVGRIVIETAVSVAASVCLCVTLTKSRILEGFTKVSES